MNFLSSYSFLWASQENLIVLLSAFIIGGVFKAGGLFRPIFLYLISRTRSKRGALLLVSMVAGVLPIEGRVSVSAPVLDSLIPEKVHGGCGCKSPMAIKATRAKMGVIDFIATHHYYLWSPLEKSVLLVMAGLGLSYSQFLSYTALPLAAYMIYLVYLVYAYLDESEIDLGEPVSAHGESGGQTGSLFNLLPFVVGLVASIYTEPYYAFPAVAAFYMLRNHTSLRQALSYIQWKTVAFVAVVITVANVIKYNSKAIQEVLVIHSNTGLPMSSEVIVLAILGGAVASFLLGSSAKYGSITAIITTFLGIKFLPLVLMSEYIGYLLSPTHKCLAISTSYFGTPWIDFYRRIGMLCLFMGISGVLVYVFK